MSEMNKVNLEELDEVTGGYSVGDTVRVRRLQAGYLALRTAPDARRENEIGALYNGDKVRIVGGKVRGGGFEGTVATYVLVYSPKYRTRGYVNAYYVG